MKSQKRRSPTKCDDKLIVLWSKWEEAFPGKSFSKYHGLFCTIRKFIRKYKIAGRISKESNEVFNSTIAAINTTTHIEVPNARTQSNLNGEIVQHEVELKKAITGKKRGSQKARFRTVDNMKLASMVDYMLSLAGSCI